MIQYRTYTIRLFPNKEQEQQLSNLSFARNMLYNILIDIEHQVYTNKGKIKTEFDLDRDITQIRKNNQIIACLNSKASQRVAKEIYSSYKSFFNLIKKDNTARPLHKIETPEKFHTVIWNQTGWKFIDNAAIKLNGIILSYKGIPGIDYDKLTVKEVKLKYVNGKYLLDLGVENVVKEQDKIVADNKVLAIDLGIKNLVNGIDNDGNWITLPNKAKKINQYFRKQISKVQSKMQKCTKGR